jgi:hypothetical protein
MGLEKAIDHKKEHREHYRDSRAILAIPPDLEVEYPGRSINFWSLEMDEKGWY